MAVDKYSAVWVSHSSMGDFLKCPRAYFLHNVYKNPKTGKKINIINPALALGQIVHEIMEGLANFKAEERFNRPLLGDFDKAWEKVSGKRGGFKSMAEEEGAKARGRSMIERVMKNPGPLKNKTVRIRAGVNDMPPNFYQADAPRRVLAHPPAQAGTQANRFCHTKLCYQLRKDKNSAACRLLRP